MIGQIDGAEIMLVLHVKVYSIVLVYRAVGFKNEN